MNKKYQIFASSTYADLIEERSALFETILRLEHIPLGMESFNADNKEQWELIKRTIDLSDYFIVVIGDRYGSINKNGVGYTEMEYDYAVANEIPVLTFIKKRDMSAITSEPLELQLKLEKFTNKVKLRMAMFWENKNELAAQVSTSIVRAIQNNPRIGWVRADDSRDTKVIPEAKFVKMPDTNRLLVPQSYEMIYKAKNSIFISGVGMNNMHAIRRELASIEPSVTIIFAVQDYENKDVMTALKIFFGFTDKQWDSRRQMFNDALHVIKANRDVNVILLDVFVPIAYVAVDYKTESEFSYIQARHYMPSDKDYYESFYLTERPGTELYNRYLNQVLLIEKANGKLAKHMIDVIRKST